MKTRWRLIETNIDSREKEYTATFVMLNVDTSEQVTVALTQSIGGPAIDLIGACRAVASAMLQAAGVQDTDTTLEKTH